MLPASVAAVVESIAHDVSPQDLRAAAAGLSVAYRQGTADTALAHPEAIAAYLVVRMPATFAAVAHSLAAVGDAVSRPKSLLDLGAGPGTATVAALLQWPSIMSATLVERDPAMARVAPAIVGAVAGESADIRVVQGDLKTADMQPHDVVILGYSLNEIPASERAALLERAWALASRMLVLVEPGTPEGFRGVLRARRQLLGLGAHVVAPCPHGLRCPMEGTESWCHFAERVARSRRHRQAKEADVGWEDEKFSYLAVSREAPPAAAARILTPPQVTKGWVRLDLCLPNGDRAAVDVARREGAAYRQASRLSWGDAHTPED